MSLASAFKNFRTYGLKGLLFDMALQDSHTWMWLCKLLRVDIDSRTKKRLTPFMLAAKAGHVYAMKLFQDAGAKIDAADEYGWTALFHAVEAGQPLAVQYLLNAGADINYQNATQNVPLFWSVYSYNPEIARLMLDHGADLLYMFLEAGANPNVQCFENGETPLMIATYNGNVDAVRVLLGFGADTQPVTIDGNTAMMYAEEREFAEITEALKAADVAVVVN